MSTPDSVISFADLSLSAPVLEAIQRIGYEQPSPIQAQSIPHLLAGRDLLGTAQTGTGKTAAFALPLLSNIDAKSKHTQVLVLAPTRELAIQVAEAFQNYAKSIPGFCVLPIYGGQSMSTQLRQLSRGAQVVVGTPGRVMDHLRRGTLSLSNITSVVLDEADEMLRMGFIDDVTWILDQAPEKRQVALFSATMPKPIQRIANQYLSNPEIVKIESKTSTVERIEQSYWMISGTNKLDALTRILEIEEHDGIILFCRTKTQTVELADKLEARGHRATAINGDMSQALREQTISQLKKGTVDILVATDVAARGIDVDRISHVINYDIPYDTESYVHRIGRTGRAGRTGKAILFVAPRERRMLHAIEKATGQKISPRELPSKEQVRKKRIEQFKQQITQTLKEQNLDIFHQLILEYQQQEDVSLEKVASALAFLAQQGNPLIVKELPVSASRDHDGGRERSNSRDKGPRQSSRGKRSDSSSQASDTYRLAVGKNHDVKPGDIVGAIANEIGIDSALIGRIKLDDDYSTVDLPKDLPKEALQHLQKVRIRQQPLKIEKMGASSVKRKKPSFKSAPKGDFKSAPKGDFKAAPKKRSAKKPAPKK